MEITANTAYKLYQNLGKHGQIVTNGMLVNVEIVDAKNAYGQVRYQVKPLSGSGLAWMNARSVQSITDPATGKLVR